MPTSHPTREPAFQGAWDDLRRRAYLGASPLGVLACVYGVAAQLPQVNPLDGVMLSIMALTMIGCGWGLWRRRLGVGAALGSVYVVSTVYFLAMLHQQYVDNVGATGRLSEAVFWFPALFCLAYLAWDLRAAALAAGVTVGGVVLITALNVPGFVARGQWNQALAGVLIQFCLSQVVLVALLYGFAFLKERYRQMQALAYHDPLTGLPNRRAAEDRVAAQPGPLSLLTFDLDHFKAVNDAHGHEVGDAVLQGVAGIAAGVMDRAALPGALLARWGGEEFVLLLPGQGEATANLLAERLRVALEAHDWGAVNRVTASFGTAEGRGGSFTETLRRADFAMYAAKQGGRNRVVAAAQVGLPLGLIAQG